MSKNISVLLHYRSLILPLVDIQSGVMISSSAEAYAGMNTTLQCSITMILPSKNVSPPTFDWFFGPNEDPLPSGVADPIMTSSGDSYKSTLQFSSMMPPQGGMYTCQLRGNERIAASTMVTVIANCKEVLRRAGYCIISRVAIFADVGF